jgi:hypothetical protein
LPARRASVTVNKGVDYAVADPREMMRPGTVFEIVRCDDVRIVACREVFGVRRILFQPLG